MHSGMRPPVTTTPSGTLDRAMATIIAVVSLEVLGLISRIFINDRPPESVAQESVQ
jgi:hypothetical protein